MSSLERFTQLVLPFPPLSGQDHHSRRTLRLTNAIQHRTLVRVANVQGEGLVQTEKVREVDRLTREASSGHVFLRRWIDTLTGTDLLLAEELRFFTDTARLGKGEILADTIDSFCRESRS